MSGHPDAQDLAAAVRGEAPEGVREHVDVCPRCAREVAGFERVRRGLRSLEPVEPSPGFAMRLLRDVQSPEPKRAPTLWESIRECFVFGPAWAMSASALLVLAGLTAVLWWMSPSTQGSKSLAHVDTTPMGMLGFLSTRGREPQPGVRAALGWLASRQEEDGGWGESTGRVVLAFLSDGHDGVHGAHARVVTRGIDWLLRHPGESLEERSIAALALYEAGLMRQDGTADAAQGAVEAALSAGADRSTSGWPGLLRAVARGGAPGWTGETEASLQLLSLCQDGGEAWLRAWGDLRTRLLATQRPDGSWGGAVRSTADAALILQTPVRYPKLRD